MNSRRAANGRQAALVRFTLFAAIVSMLSGCAAMMVGGANTGGYEPPQDECAGERGADGRCKAEQLLD